MSSASDRTAGQATGQGGAGLGRLAGKTALVTGGASGIGQACALRFAREGARVAVVDRDAGAGAEVVAQIRTAGGAALYFEAEVSELGRAAEVAAEVESDLGPLDVLLTAAGISRGQSLVDTTEESWDEVFAVNVKGTFAWMKAVLPRMSARGRGSVITVASQLAFAGGRDNAAYIASKGAVVSLTRTAALEHAARGVRINALVPGATETPLLARSLARHPDPAAARDRSRNRHAMQRFGTPEDLAAAALYLACDESAFVTGTELVVDGGWLVA